MLESDELQARSALLLAQPGLAPFNRDSGQTSGTRHLSGGRPRVRRVLYLAALSLLRTKSPLAAFYQRLRAAGKPAQVALIATAHKLLTFLNSSCRNLSINPA